MKKSCVSEIYFELASISQKLKFELSRFSVVNIIGIIIIIFREVYREPEEPN